MAKHKCPQCKKRFDYELNGWICPECGFVITAGDEESAIHQEKLELLQEQQQKAAARQARRYSSQSRHTSRPAASQQSASGMGSLIGKVIYRLICSGLLILVVFLGIGIGVFIPETMRSIEKNSDMEKPSITIEEMNKPIRAGEFSIRITQAFFPEWEEIETPEHGRYLAVRYETRGENEDDFLQDPSDVAWACLFDKTASSYLMPLYTTEMTDDDEVYSMLYGKGVMYDLSRDEGILIFLVTEPVSEYELYIVTGEENGYGQTDVLAETCCSVPLTVTEEEEEAVS
ncbi:MAG: hypothetical protein IJ512_00250 [Ruminococcus sp.]|nr:hypothetical protein [Ruminococcus sp.]